MLGCVAVGTTRWSTYMGSRMVWNGLDGPPDNLRPYSPGIKVQVKNLVPLKPVQLREVGRYPRFFAG